MKIGKETVLPSSRREFITQSGLALLAFVLPFPFKENNKMTKKQLFDVIIIGGSYSGLAAAMALGRALKKVLLIDSGKPCNAATPYSHNFLTQDGQTPSAIAALGKQQVQQYDTITFLNGLVTSGEKTGNGFEIQLASGERYQGTKLIFATGITDNMPNIDGFSACWGKSIIHCPYCHGYEVRQQPTGILGNGDSGYEFIQLISNWTGNLTLFTNGKSTLTVEQTKQLAKHQITLIEKEIASLEHRDGYLNAIVFNDGSELSLKVLYAPRPFTQHCSLPETLGCELTEEGHLKVTPFQETTLAGIYACGDNASRIRTVANAIAMGTTAGIAASKKLILEQF
ncbi:NAD(P)/FAD-dependent oxidoreductase [Flavobacterium sp.]|uniref:NAD(P)/FAD-dependent oxidoreductase n=1 Tax=Flavobacterium sp. TaxID=239 RepID=UPI002FD9266A